MNNPTTISGTAAQEHWLIQYYGTRAVFSIAWVIAALALGRHAGVLGAVLLVAYPAWDAFANTVDGIRSGGLARNPTQAVNAAVSLATACAVALALDDNARVLGVFGGWAILAGLLQFATAVRRWKTQGAQWAMLLSGAQSALAGAAFIVQSRTAAPPVLATVAGYAGFGAFYFLVSACWLGIGARRRRAA
jgi:uncharacterized membrane protein HdeD (DUF308 family)